MAFAQVGIVGFDGQIGLKALRLFGLSKATPAVLYGCPSVPVGTREFAPEISWDLPSLAPGATSLFDVTVAGCRQGDLAQAALASSTRFVELDAAAWTTSGPGNGAEHLAQRHLRSRPRCAGGASDEAANPLTEEDREAWPSNMRNRANR